MAAVCVYCSSSNAIDPAYLELAREVGQQLGRRGHSLISGGGKVGMMGAVAFAAREYGAHTLGVIPRDLVAHEVADHEAYDLLIVDTMRDRKAIMDAHADLFVILPGGIGTLEEFFEIWTAATLGMHPKQVIVIDYGDFFGPLWAFIGNLVEAGFARLAIWESLTRVASVEEAFRLIDQHRID